MNAEIELRPGAVFGSYQLERSLGAGAMGMVFLAVRLDDGAPVALKVIRPELVHNVDFRRRFVREARAARAIQHPHLVPILDVGEVGNRPYLALRYVAGGSLEDRITAEGPSEIGTLVRTIAQVGAALDALHSAEIVHRDVKPSNILLDNPDWAVLGDFGLAKGRSDSMLTRQGQVLGTVDYLAPELIRGGAATPASDIYALGCVAYACAVGKPPFAGRGMLQVGLAQLGEEPPDPCIRRPELPARFGIALLEALAKDPSHRPVTASAYAEMLAVVAESA